MKEILISIRRTPYQSLAAFLVLFFSLFLSITILFSLSFLYGLLGFVETRPQVTVYFRAQTSQNDIFKIKDLLIASDKVSTVNYISKDKAFSIYKDLNKNNPLLLEMISSDIFPPSLEVYAKKPDLLPDIAEFLKKQPGVDEVDFQKIIIERLLTFTNIIRKVSIIFFSYLAFMTLIILVTITHFKVALKREEIKLLRLLGATTFYIKKPFLKEAMFFGFTSGLFSFLIFMGILFSFNSFFSGYLNGANQLILNLNFFQFTVWPLNVTFMGLIFTITALFGIITSTIASLLATQKYIK